MGCEGIWGCGGLVDCLLRCVAFVVNGNCTLSFLAPTGRGFVNWADTFGWTRILRGFKGCCFEKVSDPASSVFYKTHRGMGKCGVGCGSNSPYHLFSYRNGGLGYTEQRSTRPPLTSGQHAAFSCGLRMSFYHLASASPKIESHNVFRR